MAHEQDVATWREQLVEAFHSGDEARALALVSRPGARRARGLLESMLRQDHIETRIAHSGREAIRVLPEFRPDLLVLDVVLPLGDGFSVVQWMRQSDRFRDLPVMVYSGRDLTSDDRARLTVGRTQFFTKGATAPNEFEQNVLALLSQVLPDLHPHTER